ncbi:MAG: hypothetical protein ACU0DH_03245, partial [Paracoccus sp. (in: a-proteobacteria)]|uniref:hypothetical protein n=1 Tax=Paracoccus sp. TaxID=267 RepID=UPI0040598EC9
MRPQLRHHMVAVAGDLLHLVALAFEFAGLAADSPKTFSFSYRNEDGRLTVNILQGMLDTMPTQEFRSDS